MIPKFRAWQKSTQSMRDVLVIDYLNGMVDLEGGEIEQYLDDIELMQSTGFKDKNGTEIFVGDIVIHTQKSINYGDVYHHSYAEVFQQQNGAYRIRGKDIYGTDAYGARKNLKVVGNIYEHAELLNKDRFMTED